MSQINDYIFIRLIWKPLYYININFTALFERSVSESF